MRTDCCTHAAIPLPTWLAGTLPESYGAGVTQGSKLAAIHLSGNALSGLLPTRWGQQLAQLEELDLSNNQLSGPLPEEWGPSLIPN